MKTKLLVINLQNPHETKYIPANTAGSFLWGRRLSNYVLMMVPDQVVIDVSAANGDCHEIQKLVTATINGTVTEYKLKQKCTQIYTKLKDDTQKSALVEAVKYYREQTNSGLAAAVDFVKSLPCYVDKGQSV